MPGVALIPRRRNRTTGTERRLKGGEVRRSFPPASGSAPPSCRDHKRASDLIAPRIGEFPPHAGNVPKRPMGGTMASFVRTETVFSSPRRLCAAASTASYSGGRRSTPIPPAAPASRARNPATLQRPRRKKTKKAKQQQAIAAAIHRRIQAPPTNDLHRSRLRGRVSCSFGTQARRQPDVANLIGYSSRKLGRYDDAKTWYEQALAADPAHARTWSYYGMWHAEQGNLLKARDYLATVATLAAPHAGNTPSSRA